MIVLCAQAEYTGPGYYRVHNVGSGRYISIKGTHYERSFRPDAFWSCAKMQEDSAQVTDPGSIIYIPDTVETSLYSQGADTYSFTGLTLNIEVCPVMHNGMITYAAHVIYNGGNFYFRDYGDGMTSSSNIRRAESHWWIEPVNEASMDSSYLGLQAAVMDTVDGEVWYWATMCCDFPMLIPKDGSVESAYTIAEVVLGSDGIYYAEPVKVCGQGDIVPAATPVLFKCRSPYASSNKVVPVDKIAGHLTMPIHHDLLMGNYYSSFYNHCDLLDYSKTAEYIPTQSTPASPQYLALTTDADGNVVFMAKEEGTYMDANSAWLDLSAMSATESDIKAVRLGAAPASEADLLRGDVNGDDKVDVADVDLLIRFIMGKEADVNPAFDVNGDGGVDVKDVSDIIQIILHGQL